MGNQELLDYFSIYDAMRARHSYGPQGHRGMSVLIFEASAIGYLEVERLHKHFVEQGTDKDSWRRTKMQHEETKEEMYMQEQFFKDQIKIIHDSRDAKEEDIKRMQPEECEKVKQSCTTGHVNAKEYRLKVEEYLKFVEVQDKEMENLVAEKEKLLHACGMGYAAMKSRHWEEEV
ncbi:hypothetical protein GYH30_052488 [Glycine max]|uniref:XS domain-containing protein n=3 Tax=Glycine subgen. Soja TaxID=1462606 RepID=A0A0R0EUG7_SOYBN|nr:hypothetical protein GYH30_052488 [Glycine max]RZB47096.1 Protein SGS3 [Glycine soja]